MSHVDYGLTGKRVLLTGGAGGLGIPMAKALIAEGARVMLTALEQDALDHAKQACAEQAAGRVETVAADLGDPRAIDDIVAAARARLGGVDILINNAGLGPSAIRPDFWKEKIRFWEANVDFRKYAEINFVAAARLAQMLVPDMLERKWGRLINVTTSFVTMLGRGCAPYGPTKAALEALTSIQAHDLEGTGICANVLIPGGATDTPMVPANPAVDRRTLIQPEVMGPVVRWLASPVSDGITGRRFLASKWDATRADEEAAELSSAPVGWPI